MKRTKAQIQARVIELLNEQIDQFGLDSPEAGLQTNLIGELGFSSIDIMHLLATVDMHFQHRMPYEQLVMKNGQYVNDLTVEEVVEFIEENLDKEMPGPIAMG